MDYKFLTLEEFTTLEKNGVLLESGVFDGKQIIYPRQKLPSVSFQLFLEIHSAIEAEQRFYPFIVKNPA